MKFIIIDDDPTGSQTVHDCILILRWDYKTLLKGLRSQSNLLFILANTRSLSEQDAIKRLEEICLSLKNVFNDLGWSKHDYMLISRGDSTLRGHNYLEPNMINKLLGPFDATFHIPAFLEGNRITINGKHFVNNIPVDQTIFAKDEIFGFETSDVRKLIYDKNNKAININQIQNISLKEIESLDIDKKNIVYKFIADLKNNVHVIIDIANYSHLNNFCYVVRHLQNRKRFLFRTAASFVSSISEINKNKKGEFYYSKLRRQNENNQFMKGIVIVGSYVDLATLQLNKILEIKECESIELDAMNMYKLFKLKDNLDAIKSLKNEIINLVRAAVKKDLIPVLFTSREIISCQDKCELIYFRNFLSLFLAEVVSEIKFEIGYLISKGGITTNTILSCGFSVDDVYLEGQILPGISLVTLDFINNNSKFPVVTFPGNLGDEDSLVKILEVIENRKF